MEESEYAKMARLQQQHWWFEVKRRLVHAVLAGVVLHRDRVPRVLEIGCGTGAMTEALGRYGDVLGVDLHRPALEFVRGATPLAADALRLPVADETMDLVACFDLLYHRNVPDLDGAFAEIARVLTPQGYLLITDSACQALYGAHDAAHHGARRFRRQELERHLRVNGLAIVHSSYFHTAVFPLVAASRIGGRWLRRLGLVAGDATGQSQLQPTPRWLSLALTALYRFEIPLAARFRLPFGVSVVVLGRRQ